MKPKPITFAARLQALLKETDISAYRLAQLTGISKQAISLFLLGKREPTFGNLVRMARALGVSLAAFDCVTVINPLPKKE